MYYITRCMNRFMSLLSHVSDGMMTDPNIYGNVGRVLFSIPSPGTCIAGPIGGYGFGGV